MLVAVPWLPTGLTIVQSLSLARQISMWSNTWSLSIEVACHAGSACAVMDVLLKQGGEQGCSLTTTDNDGNTAWHAAAEGGHIEAVQRLLQAGAPLESPNTAACTALHIAARSGMH